MPLTALDASAKAAFLAEQLAVRASCQCDDEDTQTVLALCQEAAHQAIHMAVRAGAISPYPGQAVGDRLRLSDLAALDSPEARELYLRLKALLPLAQRVDMGRGRTQGGSSPLCRISSRGCMTKRSGPPAGNRW